jgi:hypothetical protein
MASDPGMGSFEEFWPHYLRNHSKKSTQVLHLVGVGAGFGALAAGLTSRRRRWLIALAPALGFGPAWLGHLVFEGNRPTTFDHPLWALRAGLRMVEMMVAGTLSDEVASAMAATDEGDEQPAEPTEADGQRDSEATSRDSQGNGNGAGRMPPPDPHSLN